MWIYHNSQNNTVLNFNIIKNSTNKLNKRASNKVLKLLSCKVNFKWLKINFKKLKEFLQLLKRILMTQKIKKNNSNKLLRQEINKFWPFKLNFLLQDKTLSLLNNQRNLSFKRQGNNWRKQEMNFNHKS